MYFCRLVFVWVYGHVAAMASPTLCSMPRRRGSLMRRSTRMVSERECEVPTRLIREVIDRGLPHELLV